MKRKDWLPWSMLQSVPRVSIANRQPEARQPPRILWGFLSRVATKMGDVSGDGSGTPTWNTCAVVGALLF